MFRIARLVLLSCGLLLASGLTASAAISFMRGTTGDGTRYLVVEGAFEHSDRVENLLTEAQQHSPAFVAFNSIGGNVYSAMRLGRVIRVLGLNTFQIRELECSSACALAFVGGVERYAAPGSIGVHRSSFDETSGMDRDGAVAAVQAGTADMIAYLIEMGIDPGLLQLSLQYDSSDIRYLSASEMAQYRVTSFRPEAASPQMASPPSLAPLAATREASNPFTIPTPLSGQIRHPSGSIVLRATPDEKGIGISRALNATRLEIIGANDRWYRVSANGQIGYAHHTWVKVDQFYPAPFEQKYVQIKSFDNFADAERFIRQSSFPLAAYLATNGWFAVTVDGVLNDAQATEVLKSLKAENLIPDDSYKTYGNTYVRQVCCN